MSGPERVLELGLAQLRMDAALREPLLRYLDELAKWNRAYNLTAVRAPAEMVTRHLLDSLAALPTDDARELRVLDLGSGAGLPGIVWALARPDWRFVLLDSNGKKARFLRHAQRELRLHNVEVIAARAEDFAPAEGFDRIVSRAFASLAGFIDASRHLLAPAGEWLAMKGKLDASELAATPADVEIREMLRLQVPGLDEARHLIRAIRRPPSASA